MLIGALLAAPASAKTPCRQEFTFRANPLIGISAISKLSRLDPANDAPRTTDGAELVVWPFDEEDYPTFGRYRAIALVFATRGDLGEEPVGGMLMQDRSAPTLAPTELRVKPITGGVMLQSPAQGSCPAFIVRLMDGGALSVQGQVIGRLR